MPRSHAFLVAPALNICAQCKLAVPSHKVCDLLEECGNVQKSATAVTKTLRGYKVDQRVYMALNALDPEEQRVIRDILEDRAHFLASTADRQKVRRISKNEPLYALRVPSDLRIIYSQVGDEIVVMDLMHRAVLAEYGPRSTAEAEGRGTR
jgi:ribosomal protein L32